MGLMVMFTYLIHNFYQFLKTYAKLHNDHQMRLREKEARYGNLPMIWWLLFHIGTQSTERM